MYLALPIKTVFYTFGASLVLFFLLLSSIKGGFSFNLISLSLLITTGLFWLLGATPVWRKLWKRFPQLNRWVFPDLNGVWQGEQESNWPIIERLINASSTQQEIYNADQPDVSLLKTKVTVRITANLFRVKVTLVSQPRSPDLSKPYSESYTYLAVPRKNPDTDAFELFYFYKNTTTNPVTTDTNSHDGAAKLEVTADGKLKGINMTNRQWHRGMNTAGELVLERISEDPEANE
ncbi:hypothetical protein [Leucothrix pacifica]|uniref:Uncharacterized protein n=1 Tax=Leucothrix pacifica TaxID=1247513 RepID=A0A317C2B8_9GAMM|nr:hypothetical protein [Leucothrix pacifica]PWQ92331.1 hypothetical protein DKW60_21825 [Leucothrix pacifica]